MPPILAALCFLTGALAITFGFVLGDDGLLALGAAGLLLSAMGMLGRSAGSRAGPAAGTSVRSTRWAIRATTVVAGFAALVALVAATGQASYLISALGVLGAGLALAALWFLLGVVSWAFSDDERPLLRAFREEMHDS